jgi:hypothetical protein
MRKKRPLRGTSLCLPRRNDFQVQQSEKAYLFRDTIQKLIEAPVLEYKDLIAA